MSGWRSTACPASALWGFCQTGPRPSGGAEPRSTGCSTPSASRIGREALAGSLPLPDQRRLELVRALVRSPVLLLLDEPAGGMTPAETAEMAALIRDFAVPGRTCIVIEHKLDLISELCQRLCVLNFGRKIADGVPQEVLRQAEVLEAYLGGDALDA